MLSRDSRPLLEVYLSGRSIKIYGVETPREGRLSAIISTRKLYNKTITAQLIFWPRKMFQRGALGYGINGVNSANVLIQC